MRYKRSTVLLHLSSRHSWRQDHIQMMSHFTAMLKRFISTRFFFLLLKLPSPTKQLVTATQLQWWDFLRVCYQLDPGTMDTAHANLCTGFACPTLLSSSCLPLTTRCPFLAGAKWFSTAGRNATKKTPDNKKCHVASHQIPTHTSIWRNRAPVNIVFIGKAVR